MNNNLYDKKCADSLNLGIITVKQHKHLVLCDKLIADCRVCTKLVPKLQLFED